MWGMAGTNHGLEQSSRVRVYRRQMKTIGYLGQIDQLFGVPATTRSWNTILSVLRILKSHGPGK